MPNGMERRAFLAAGLAFAVVRLARAKLVAPALGPLAKGLRGRLITPVDPDYDRERRVFWRNTTTDRWPAAIAKCAHEDDIVRCLEFAETSGLEVAVRSGGHDALGASTCDGGLIIDLRPLAGCVLDSERRAAIVGAGAKTGEVIAALQPATQVIPFGDSPDVGVAGISLGGGYGWLAGRYGATCDHVLRARLVLADGRRLTVSADSEPDLFWAIRGGGGNFGVVTQFEFRTQPLDLVIAGKALFPAGDLGGFLRLYRESAANAPDALQVEIGLGAAGGSAILAQFCWSGDSADAERVLSPLLSYGPPVATSIAQRPYSQVGTAPAVDAVLRAASTGPRPTGMRAEGGTIPGLTDPIIAVIETHARQAPPGCAFNIVHHLHGAVVHPRPQDRALIRIAGSFCYHIDSFWTERQTARQSAWTSAFQQALEPHSVPSYVNYLSSDAPAAVARTYGSNFDRLRAIKRRYDPKNRFHGNRNIPPAPEA